MGEWRASNPPRRPVVQRIPHRKIPAVASRRHSSPSRNGTTMRWRRGIFVSPRLSVSSFGSAWDRGSRSKTRLAGARRADPIVGAPNDQMIQHTGGPRYEISDKVILLLQTITPARQARGLAFATLDPVTRKVDRDTPYFGPQPLLRIIARPAGGVANQTFVLATTEQFVNRQIKQLTLQIPQRAAQGLCATRSPSAFSGSEIVVVARGSVATRSGKS